MIKFTVLKYNKFILSHLGISIKQSSNRTIQNVFCKAISSYYILTTMIVFVVASVMFVLQNLSQYNVALRTCAIAIATSQSIGMYFCFGINVNKINALHFKLQEIIDELAKGEDSFV